MPAPEPTSRRLVLDPRDCLRLFLEQMRAHDAPQAVLDAAVASAARQPPPVIEPLPETPRISCLMVSRNPLEIVRRSVQCYLDQTYANRELVLVRDPRAPHAEVEAYIESLGRADIRWEIGHGATTLCALRNVSLRAATGEVCCIWDDDDLSHPDRLTIQLDAMIADGSGACYLQDELDWYVASGELHWICWDSILYRCHLGTGMFQKDGHIPYAEGEYFSTRSEDALFFVSQKRPVTVITGMPQLFVYGFHGGNTWGMDHRLSLQRHLGVPRERVLARAEELGREVARVGLQLTVDPAAGAVPLRVAARPVIT